jgi:hypothetical protein
MTTLQQQISDGISDIARFYASVGSNRNTIKASATENFVQFADSYLPIVGTKSEKFFRLEAENLFSQYEAALRKRLGEPKVDMMLATNHKNIQEGFHQYAKLATELRLTTLSQDYAKHMDQKIAAEFNHSDFDSLRQHVLAETHQQNKNAENKILADLDAELESINRRQYPAKKRGK